MHLNHRNTIRYVLASVLAVALLSTGIVAVAQEGRPDEEAPNDPQRRHHMHARDLTEQERLELMNDRLDRRVDRLRQELGLSDRQADDLRQIMEQRRRQTHDIRRRHRRAARKETRVVHRDARQKIDALLNDEQRQALKELRKEHRQKRIERGVGRLSDRLGLDDDQETSVQSTLEGLATDLKNLRADTDLAGKEKRQKARALFDRTFEAIKAELDEAQTAEFERIEGKLKRKMLHRGPRKAHHGRRRGHHRHRR